MEERNETGKCLMCGRELHDKRPYCRECRQKKELERRIAEKNGEKAGKPKNSAKLTIIAVLAVMILAAVIIAAQNSRSKKPAEPEGFGSILIESDPPGADVISLDGSFAPGKTPLKVEKLKSGRIYKFTLDMDGCGNTNEISGVKVEKDRESKYMGVLERQGILSVNSTPAGAAVIIDGTKTDQVTPAEIKGVPEGKRKVRLEFSKDVSSEAECEVKWRETTHFHGLADKEKSGIEFKVPDDVKVFADGKYLGRTPLPVAIVPEGAHEISLVSEKFMPVKEVVATEKGKVAKYSPALQMYGILEITAKRRAYLYKGNEMAGALPMKVYCRPGEKFVADVQAEDGAVWKQGFVMKEGEYRRVEANLPPPPPPPTFSASDAPSYSPPFTDFSGFNVESYFPPSQWQKTEDFMEDMDQDGESERILGFKNLQESGSGGNKVYAFIIKKHDGQFYDRIPLRNPRLGCLGEGEIISLEAVKADQFGYREIVYSVGNTKDGITQKGSFAIYKGQCYSPSWSGR